MKKLLIIVLFLAVALSFVPMLSHAQEGLVTCGGETQPACELCHLFQLINNILNWVLFVLVPIIAPIFIVVGGIYLLIARGNPEMFNKGKSVLTATIIGLIIVYTAYVLLSTVLTTLGVFEWTGLTDNPLTPEKEGWWKIPCPI